jgi:hypothetical protein
VNLLQVQSPVMHLPSKLLQVGVEMVEAQVLVEGPTESPTPIGITEQTTEVIDPMPMYPGVSLKEILWT